MTCSDCIDLEFNPGYHLVEDRPERTHGDKESERLKRRDQLAAAVLAALDKHKPGWDRE